LRERKGDIPLLVNHFLGIFRKKYQKREFSIEPEVFKMLMEYPWPGNIRELRHAVERAVIMAEGQDLQTSDFIPASNLKNNSSVQSSVHMDEVEKQAIQKALKKNNGNFTLAASELGIGRTTLYRKMKKYHLK
jgi:two-component system response regulator HydG